MSITHPGPGRHSWGAFGEDIRLAEVELGVPVVFSPSVLRNEKIDEAFDRPTRG